MTKSIAPIHGFGRSECKFCHAVVANSIKAKHIANCLKNPGNSQLSDSESILETLLSNPKTLDTAISRRISIHQSEIATAKKVINDAEGHIDRLETLRKKLTADEDRPTVQAYALPPRDVA